MSYLAQVNFTDRDGHLSTEWIRPAVEVRTDAQPAVMRAIGQIKRRGGTQIRVDVADDARWTTAFRYGVK
jgi:hypothetical protein